MQLIPIIRFLDLPSEIIQNIFLLSLNPSVLVLSKTSYDLCHPTFFKAKWILQLHLPITAMAGQYEPMNAKNTHKGGPNNEQHFSVHPRRSIGTFYFKNALLKSKCSEDIGLWYLNNLSINRIDYLESLFYHALENMWPKFLDIFFNLLEDGKESREDNDKPPILRLLLNRKFKLEALNIYFIECCRTGDLFVIRKLMNHPFIDIHFEQGAALSACAKYGQLVCAESLLKAGANPNINNGHALCCASIHGHDDVVQLLLSYGADSQSNGNLPIRSASEFGYVKIVQLLLGAGANIHVDQDYPLRWSAARGHACVVQLLLANNANVHAMSNFALKGAFHYGYVEVVDILLAHGADLNEIISSMDESTDEKMSAVLCKYIPKPS